MGSCQSNDERGRRVARCGEGANIRTMSLEMSALDAAAAVRRREVSPVELVEHALARIDQLDGQLGSFVTVTEDRALDEARRAERQVLTSSAVDELPPLLGVPTAIKDLNAVAGVPMKLGSRAFEHHVPDYDDTVARLLRASGAISLGKTATPEFGLPCYTETDIGAPTRNPWDRTLQAGGSSGGAAAAVAAGLVPFAQATDGGGSIRIPASVCGLVGLKPARGRISKGPRDMDATRLGVFGPITRTVRDAAAFMDATAGPQPGDADPLPPLPAGETFLKWCDRDPGRLRIGRFTDSPAGVPLDPQIRSAWEDTSALLDALGHDVEDVPAPLPAEAVPLFETLWMVTAAAVRVPSDAEPLLRPLTRYFRERGRAIDGPDFASALAQLAAMSRRAIASTEHLDAVLVPTLAQLPRPVGWFTDGIDPAEDFARQQEFMPYAWMYNLTGQPALSLPLSWSSEGWPIGMMLVGRRAGERTLLSLAAQVEQARPWVNRRPPI